MSPAISQLFVTSLIRERNALAIRQFYVRNMESRGIKHDKLVVRKQNYVHSRDPGVPRHQSPRPFEVRRKVGLRIRIELRVAIGVVGRLRTSGGGGGPILGFSFFGCGVMVIIVIAIRGRLCTTKEWEERKIEWK